jgi:hypothetical protein
MNAILDADGFSKISKFASAARKSRVSKLAGFVVSHPFLEKPRNGWGTQHFWLVHSVRNSSWRVNLHLRMIVRRKWEIICKNFSP